MTKSHFRHKTLALFFALTHNLFRYIDGIFNDDDWMNCLKDNYKNGDKVFFIFGSINVLAQDKLELWASMPYSYYERDFILLLKHLEKRCKKLCLD